MKKSLLLVVSLLAIASLMAAMAYSNANVTNATTMEVVNTNEALLALEPSDMKGNADENAYVDGGVLKFDFSKGLNGQSFGLQPNSHYHWDPLFKVTNNSNETIDFAIKFQNGSSHKPQGSNWTFTAGLPNDDSPVGGQNTFKIFEWNNGSGTTNKYTLQPGEFVWVELDLHVNNNAVDFTSPIIISAGAK